MRCGQKPTTDELSIGHLIHVMVVLVMDCFDDGGDCECGGGGCILSLANLEAKSLSVPMYYCIKTVLALCSILCPTTKLSTRGTTTLFRGSRADGSQSV